MIASRRSFLLGAGALLAAPSIVRVASLMPVSVLPGYERFLPIQPAPVSPEYAEITRWLQIAWEEFNADWGASRLEGKIGITVGRHIDGDMSRGA